MTLYSNHCAPDVRVGAVVGELRGEHLARVQPDQ